jgi:ribosomal protein S18 acetylase RimI-like enzyme
MKYIKNFEYLTSDKKFIINDNKFQLFLDDNLVTESNFTIEQPDEFFNEEYVTIYDFKTFEDYQGKGFAKYLLNEIFNYVKNELKINIITLNVYKKNTVALNLYLKSGFEVFINYKNSYSLIKKSF